MMSALSRQHVRLSVLSFLMGLGLTLVRDKERRDMGVCTAEYIPRVLTTLSTTELKTG